MATQTKTQISRIKVEDLRRRMKELVFVDARSATALKKIPQEIPKAIHVPIKQFEENLRKLPHDRTLITYCT
jgi:rhodanese-related sulfurtransferase